MVPSPFGGKLRRMQSATTPGAGTLPGLTLGPFAVERDGTLTPRQAGLQPAMRFAWRQRRCEASLADGRVRLASRAARIPFSAEAGADRERAFATLAALPGSLPRGWKARLLPDHSITLETEAPLEAPPTAVGLVAAMVRFALALDPYLDRLEAACCASPGTAKTWPG
jgi:hypothetical protein